MQIPMRSKDYVAVDAITAKKSAVSIRGRVASPDSDGAASAPAGPQGRQAEQLIAGWLAQLPVSSSGNRGGGGWVVYPCESAASGAEAVEIVSGGEDAADTLGFAAAELLDWVAHHAPGVAVEWEGPFPYSPDAR